MLRNIKAVSLAALAVAGTLVPLYGDPRSSPVTHSEWARMLLRALELDDVTPPGAQASRAFATLSWRNSLAYPADRYVRAEGVRVITDGGRPRVVPTDGTGEVAYTLGIARGGDYRLRVRMAGDPKVPASVEITQVGDSKPKKSFAVVPASATGWIEAGTAHLDPGAYTASLLLPPGTTLENVEVAPPCVSPIEPPRGWQALRVLDGEDLAVTALKALDLESELPPADVSIELTGADFQVPQAAILASGAGGAVDGLTLRGGPLGVQAMMFVNIPETGLYTISSFGLQGSGQSWLLDACSRAVLCETRGAAATAAAPEWRDVTTTTFSAGPHYLTVTLGNGASVERVRVQRKKESPADYVATLARVGFDLGGAGPVARGRAVDAMNFIQGRRKQVHSAPCDVLIDFNPNQRSVLAEPTAPVLGPTIPLSSGSGLTPLEPPVIPPQDTASPVLPGL